MSSPADAASVYCTRVRGTNSPVTVSPMAISPPSTTSTAVASSSWAIAASSTGSPSLNKVSSSTGTRTVGLHAFALDVDLPLTVDGTAVGELQRLVFGHGEHLDAAAEAGRRVLPDDRRPVLEGQVVGEELAGAVAVRPDEDGDRAVVAQVLGRRDVGGLGRRIEVELAETLVVEAGVAQRQRVVEEVGGHLVGEESRRRRRSGACR